MRTAREAVNSLPMHTLCASQDRKFYAHRIALLASSECFRAMFDGHYKEKQASVIPIPNIRFAVFERMMRCIYTGARVTCYHPCASAPWQCSACTQRCSLSSQLSVIWAAVWPDAGCGNPALWEVCCGR
jgi:BTB/POZ domain